MKQFQTLLFLFCFSQINAQLFTGFQDDNYSGIHALMDNPARIADSRHKFDLNLTSVSTHIENDYASIPLLDIKNDFDLNRDSDIYKKDNNNLFSQLELLGPSFLVSINERISFALSTRVRNMSNIDNINGETLKLITNGYDLTNDIKVDESNLRIVSNLWGEGGISLGVLVLNKPKHAFKVGITGKYLYGLANMAITTNDLNIEYKTSSNPPNIITNGKIQYTYSGNIEESNISLEDLAKFNSKNNGYGFDLGFVYEWRPNIKNHSYTDMNGKLKSYRNENKYKLRLSVAVKDIGSINYKDNINEVYNTSAQISDSDIEENKSLRENFSNLFNLTNVGIGTDVKLPTSLSVNLDVRATEKLYLNLGMNKSLLKGNEIGNRIPTRYYLTPRVEGKIVSTYFPISYSDISGFNSGFGLRLGFINIGSNTIITNILNNSKAVNLYAGIKIPISHRKKKDSEEFKEILDGEIIIDNKDDYDEVIIDMEE